MSYKETTKQSYEVTAKDYMRNVADLAPIESIQRFVELLPISAKIIDIGCGSGRDAKLFTDKGLSVLGIDFCQSQLDLAKANAPLARFQLMDIETATFSDSIFDGAWAGCSLMHIPKKVVPDVLNNIHSFLKRNGYFYLTLKKGSGEGMGKDLRYGEYEKFCSYYEEDEIKELVQKAKFKIIECSVIEKRSSYQTHPVIRIFCKTGQ